MGSAREPGVVVDELEDSTLQPAGEHALGSVELPVGVRDGINEPPIRGSQRLLRLHLGDTASQSIHNRDAPSKLQWTTPRVSRLGGQLRRRPIHQRPFPGPIESLREMSCSALNIESASRGASRGY